MKLSNGWKIIHNSDPSYDQVEFTIYNDLDGRDGVVSDWADAIRQIYEIEHGQANTDIDFCEALGLRGNDEQ